MRCSTVRFVLLAISLSGAAFGVERSEGSEDAARAKAPAASTIEEDPLVVREGDARPAEETSSPGDYRVDFSAGRVDVDAKLKELELSDDVVVRVDRYRITADKLRLSRGPRGIVIDGDGRVAFCRCEDPPFTFGFSAATAAPPTDLLIEDPTLRVYDVPILWLPYLWLRAPDRLGVLPPRVAWRGDDGLLLGSGVHVPLGSAEAGARAPTLDLEAAGYVLGGVEVKSRLATARDSVEARFDHKAQSLLAVDARGAHSTRGYATWAYRADAIRGPRGLSGTPALYEAAQRYDRVRAEVGRHHGGPYYALGGSATAVRGGDFDQTGALGPTVVGGFGEALGSVGDTQLAVAGASLDDPILGPTNTLRQLAQVRLHARPGPLAAEFEVAERSLLSSSELLAESSASVGGRAELGLPLRRSFGEDDPWLHTVSPLVAASARRHFGQALSSDTVPSFTTLAKWGVGARTTLGRWGMKSGAQLGAEAGWVRFDETLREVAEAELIVSSHYFAVYGEAVALLRDPLGWVHGARARLGPEAGLQLALYVEGQRGVAVEEGRWLLDRELSDDLGAPWYDTLGYTTGGELRVPFTRHLASAVAADFDAEESELLGVRGSLGYRHPCGCFATVAWAGRRIARPGVDAWLTMDLMP